MDVLCKRPLVYSGRFEECHAAKGTSLKVIASSHRDTIIYKNGHTNNGPQGCVLMKQTVMHVYKVVPTEDVN